MKTALILFFAISVSFPLLAQDAQILWKEDSPDGSYLAAARRIPDRTYLWRDDLDGFRLVVFSLKRGPDKLPGKLYFSRDFPGRVPAQMQWSPNSRFLVLTTTSSGGHSLWHYTTFILNLARHRILSPDDSVGPVVSPEISFKAPDVVVLEIGKKGEQGVDFEHPIKTTINLSRLFSGGN